MLNQFETPARRFYPLFALVVAMASLGTFHAAGAGARPAVNAPHHTAAASLTRSRAERDPAAAATKSHAWPFKELQIGMQENELGGASQLRHAAPFGMRYQYLSGGVDTGQSWRNWGSGGLSYVKDYISDSEDQHLLPIFTYYQLRQSQPGVQTSDEAAADHINLTNSATMKDYYADLTAFFHAAASTRKPVVLQFEPDAFGYAEQGAKNNSAANVPADVSSTKIAVLQGLPNTVAGWAQAVVRLRNKYAQNVILAYADSIWGTNKDIHLSHPSATETATMAAESAAWYRSLHARFDMIFTEVGNADAAQADSEVDSNAYIWHKVDYQRDLEYIADLHKALKLPFVIWQIPIGNTIMRAMNNTPYHWQDNHAQSYLGAGASSYLKQLVKAGVVGLLFGSPQTTGTTALPAKGAKIRNPAPIDGNTTRSYTAADDGGYLVTRVRDYYHGHELALPQ